MAVKLSRELYESMLGAYRLYPGVHSRASNASGSTREFCKKTWELGWPNKGTKSWARPIKDVIEDEKWEARVKRQQAEAEAENKARDAAVQARVDAIQARAQEAQGAKLSRSNAINLAVVSGRTLQSALKISEELQRRVDTNLATMDLADIRKLLLLASSLTHRSQSVLRLALEIERVVVGEPVKIVGVRVDGMSVDQIHKELEGVARTLANANAALSMGADEDDVEASVGAHSVS